jgi:hypothetical protein
MRGRPKQLPSNLPTIIRKLNVLSNFERTILNSNLKRIDYDVKKTIRLVIDQLFVTTALRTEKILDLKTLISIGYSKIHLIINRLCHIMCLNNYVTERNSYKILNMTYTY